MRILLWPFALLYGLTVRLRNICFNVGILRETKFSVPVICVGNLTVGGTGKSPHVLYLARLLSSGNSIAILSRGYGRKSKGYLVVNENDTAINIGDEPLQYKKALKNIHVAVSENRVNGINKIIELKNKPDVILLDDAYQHRYVKAGLNILLTQYDHLYTRDHLLPVGRLREPKVGAGRADIIIVTKCDENIAAEEKMKIIKELNPHSGQRIYFSYIRYREELTFQNGSTFPLSDLSKKKIILLTGIANPESLRKFITTYTDDLEQMTFPDHHNYTVGDMVQLRQKFDRFASAGRNNVIIITTRKDDMRLQLPELQMILKDLPVAVIDMDIEIILETEKFNKQIIDYVESRKSIR